MNSIIEKTRELVIKSKNNNILRVYDTCYNGQHPCCVQTGSKIETVMMSHEKIIKIHKENGWKNPVHFTQT